VRRLTGDPERARHLAERAAGREAQPDLDGDERIELAS
jgi:hypothetical protein